MSHSPKPARREVRLQPHLQARLLEQMRAEQAASMRGRAIRRYVALPCAILAVAGSLVMMVYGDGTTSLVGNLIASLLLWFFWLIRKQLARVFGFG